MQGGLPGGAVEGPAQRLAVDRHHPLGRLGEALHEAQEAGMELHRIEQPEQPAEGVVARSAMPQAQELPQKRFLRSAEQRHVRTILRATQNRTQRDQ